MSENKDQQKAFLLALIAVLCWSTVPTAFKLGLRFQDNYQMLTGAALVSTLVLGLTVVVQKKILLFKELTFHDLLKSALLGIINPAIYYLILFKAYDLLPGQVAQPLNMIWPIMLVLISIPILKQRIGWKNVLAMIISFGGVAVLSFQGGNIIDEPSSVNGVFLALASSVIWAFYWIINMKNKLDEVLGLFLIFSFATLFLLAGGIFKEPILPGNSASWIASAYIGIFEMSLAFVLWLKALKLSVTTAKVSNLIFIAPFLNLIFVKLFLGESIYISTIFGIILVLTGIFLQNAAKGKNITS